jgi:hypothetical protein
VGPADLFVKIIAQASASLDVVGDRDRVQGTGLGEGHLCGLVALMAQTVAVGGAYSDPERIPVQTNALAAGRGGCTSL